MAVPTYNTTNAVSLPSFYCMYNVPFPLYPTKNIGPTDLSILLQHHISNFPGFLIYFPKSPIFRVEAMLQL